MSEAFTVRREIQIEAPQAAVFAFLTDPEKIIRWVGTKATVESHLDGLYQLNVRADVTGQGRFTEVIPVHRLAYSFGWKGIDKMPPGSTLIEIDLLEHEGGTLLRLTHSGLPDAELCAAHERGWSHYLPRLAVAAAGGDPGPDSRTME